MLTWINLISNIPLFVCREFEDKKNLFQMISYVMTSLFSKSLSLTNPWLLFLTKKESVEFTKRIVYILVDGASNRDGCYSNGLPYFQVYFLSPESTAKIAEKKERRNNSFEFKYLFWIDLKQLMWWFYDFSCTVLMSFHSIYLFIFGNKLLRIVKPFL